MKQHPLEQNSLEQDPLEQGPLQRHLCLPTEGQTPQDCQNCSVSRAGHYEAFVKFLRFTYSNECRVKYGLFDKHEREDIISEFVIRVHKQFDTSSGSESYRLRTATFGTWANKVFYYVWVDHLRKMDGRKKTSGKEDEKSSGATISNAQRNAIMSICTRKGITEQELKKQIEETYKSTLDNLNSSEATSLIKNLQYDDQVKPCFKLVSIEEILKEVSNLPADDNDSKLKDLLTDALTELMKNEKYKESCCILIDYCDWGKEGIGQAEMAERYGISYDNFRVKLSRARRILKKKIRWNNEIIFQKSASCQAMFLTKASFWEKLPPRAKMYHQKTIVFA